MKYVGFGLGLGLIVASIVVAVPLMVFADKNNVTIEQQAEVANTALAKLGLCSVAIERFVPDYDQTDIRIFAVAAKAVLSDFYDGEMLEDAAMHWAVAREGILDTDDVGDISTMLHNVEACQIAATALKEQFSVD